jgi:predicted nucleic acid-binding Zn ribbon protein
VSEDEPRPKTGIELAREALAQARADAAKRQSVPGARRGRRTAAGSPRDPRRGGGPQTFATGIKQLLADRGWEERAALGGVFGDWERVVGRDLAEHTRPGTFEDGELVVSCDSPAWAQQVRLLAAQLVRRLNEELGEGTVRRVKVVGPQTAPRQGRWRVR